MDISKRRAWVDDEDCVSVTDLFVHDHAAEDALDEAWRALASGMARDRETGRTASRAA